MNILDTLARQSTVETKRRRRADELLSDSALSITFKDSDSVAALVNGHHSCAIERQADQTLTFQCSCQDWKTRGIQHNMPCKHLLALAMDADKRNLMGGSAPPPKAAPKAPPPPGTKSPKCFQDQVRQAIGTAVAQLANQVQDALAGGGIPFLVGPTGAGKTSAVRMVATGNGWGFEEVAGSQSFADADLVGLRTGQIEIPGIFARAFQRARNGEPVLLFLDELLRLNQRAQDVLMRPLQIASVEVANALQIQTTKPVRIVEAPLWGMEHAPADLIHVVLAANPWGSALDPALVRRVDPIEVSMADAVADLFEDTLAAAIRASWKSVERGELPLPIEYQSLSQATSPGDMVFLQKYLIRLQVLDPAAADGYRHLLSGLGVTL